jgi:nitrate/TMAO reductase-like tetraheme cytochrome c subunit
VANQRSGRQKTNPRAKADRREKPAPDPATTRRWLIIGVALAVVALAAFVGVARATDTSNFCNGCHEMTPFYEAWTQGGHKTDAQCIDCHVNAGFFPRLGHKFIALGEVWAHFTGNTDFPRPVPADVPDRRCVKCHPKVNTTALPASFSHEMHAKQGPCQMCHATVGHNVTAEALQAAGIYSPANAALRATVTTTGVAAAGGGKANIPGHVPVACSQCHDMAAMGCPSCHKPPHEPRGNCVLCHAPGPKFAFNHPQTQMPNWQSIPCKKCHPASYTKVYCTCHKGRTPTGD